MFKQISEMTTTEMLAEYNSLTGKAVKKFSSRAAGEKQLEKAREQHQASSAQEPLFTPEPNTTQEDTVETKELNTQEVDTQEAAELVAKCPKCGKTEDQTPAGLDNTVAGEKRVVCQYCVVEYWVETGEIYENPGKSQLRSEAIANSWKNPEVAEKRSQRTSVAVEGHGTYRSVKDAFTQLGLPLGKHITFRMQVKKEGFAIFRHDGAAYNFSVVA